MSTDSETLESTTPSSLLKKKTSISERVIALGIPLEETSSKVLSVITGLLKKIDTLSQELARSKDNFIELEKLVDVDSIAPVPNRRAFMRRLNWALAMHERYGHPCSILYFDINDFKQINDTYGHAAGDMAIRHVSKIFTESLRGSDFMARLSGDEFAVLMYYAEFNSAQRRGSKIAAHIAATPLALQKEKISITAAYGAYQVKKGDDAEGALAHADAAMYQNKKASKEADK